MKNKNRVFLGSLLIMQVLLCILTLIFAFLLTENISLHTEEVLEQETLNITEDSLRERVNNMILYIDYERDKVQEEVKLICDLISDSVVQTSERDLYKFLTDWAPQISDMEYGQPVQILLHNMEEQTVTLFAEGVSEDVTERFGGTVSSEDFPDAFYCNEILFDHTKLYVLVTEDDLNDVAKSFIYDLIHASVYGTEGYVWVNEVINYEGGDDYAIRVIHPNLVATEGRYLSTYEADIAGGFPYAAELEGIKENGEILHSYFFYNKSNSEIMEKLSYARLYEPFDWIVATGEPLDDIFYYAEDMKTYNQQVFNGMLRNIIIALIAVFAFDIFLIIVSNQRYHKNVVDYVESETKLDALTGAYIRKTGDNLLKEIFKKFKQDETSSLLMMLDIDDFKKVNDTYGHDVGDIVLKRISQEIQNNIRDTDCLIRWGGEEFMLLYPVMDQMHHRQVGEKILECVRKQTFESGKDSFRVTVSIGSSFFHKGDADYLQAVKRADVALYHSKQTGKNRYTNSEEDM